MSLRLRLLLILGISLCVLWGAVAGWMFMDARQSIRNALDNRLAASARMVAGLVLQFPNPVDIATGGRGQPLDVIARDGVACEVSLVRDEVVIDTIAKTAGSPGLQGLATGFSTHVYGNKRWRTFVLREGNVQIATADRIDVRQELLKELALSAGLPFVIALLGSMVLLWFGIGKGLEPLEHIRNLLARRRADDDSALPAVKAPAELRPLVHTIERLLERVQAAIMRERRFTSNAAHELRTPLTGIKTHIQVARLASQRPDSASVVASALGSAEEGVQLLQGILERLLELARVEGQPDETELTDAHEAACAAIETVRDHGDCTARIRLHTSDPVPQVRVARSLLVSALHNLLDNALRYAPADTMVDVRIVRADSESVQFSVLDTGPGLDDRERAQATQRFWRGDAVSPGSGLGLAIVDAIARRHGGALALFAREGPGLEARLVFPAAAQGMPPAGGGV